MPSTVMEPLGRTLAAAASRRTWCGWLSFELVSPSTTVYTSPGGPPYVETLLQVAPIGLHHLIPGSGDETEKGEEERRS